MNKDLFMVTSGGINFVSSVSDSPIFRNIYQIFLNEEKKEVLCIKVDSKGNKIGNDSLLFKNYEVIEQKGYVSINDEIDLIKFVSDNFITVLAT